MTRALFPVATLERIEVAEANRLLARWGHHMGPMNRPAFQPHIAHALFQSGEPVAITIAAGLVRDHIAGWPQIDRSVAIELARLCAARPGLCRVMLRMWREFVLPDFQQSIAISFQCRALHTGDTYRFDGWRRIGTSSSGTDKRTGRKGRNKAIWAWPRDHHLFEPPSAAEDTKQTR